MTGTVTTGLPTMAAGDLPRKDLNAPWMIQQLWASEAVGVIGGPPKAGKSWLGLDMAIAVASGTACLGRFPVDDSGPALVYLAEDALHDVRDRIRQLAQHRGLTLSQLSNLHVITAPSLRLDVDDDQKALTRTIENIRPRMLLLDPLVRLHRLDENSAADISQLLGFLRHLNRHLHIAIVLVHHMAKRARHDPGQALRGSSDLYAWIDSGCYLIQRQDHLQLSIQHRAAPAPEPMKLKLEGGNGRPCHLTIEGIDDHPPPLAEAVRELLREAQIPCSRTELRRRLRVNNARLGETLEALEENNLVIRGPKGWELPKQDLQLCLNT